MEFQLLIKSKVLKSRDFFPAFKLSDVVLFDLILYVPSTIFQLYRDGSSWVPKLGLMCHAQGHNAVTPVRLEPAASQSQVKLSTTEPLRYHISDFVFIMLVNFMLSC